MREIEVETFLKPMGQGITRPALVLGDDSEEYILKNQESNNNGSLVNYDCMFVNELLAFQIGDYLGIPMPEAVIAMLDKLLIETDPTIRFSYRFKEGKFFATKNIKEVENNILENYQQLKNMNKPYLSKSWKSFFNKIDNKDDIAKIIAFDILIANFDRYSNEGNLLVSSENGRKVYAIDHGHAFFGPTWNLDKINCLRINNITMNYINFFVSLVIDTMRISGQCSSGIIFSALQECINLEDVENHSFKDIVCKINSINEEMIIRWCNNIPDEWYVDKESQIAHYSNFILKQKNIVHVIIQVLAEQNAFSNYRGGELKYGSIKKENSI